MEVALAYDHRTTLATTLGAAALDFAANLRRRPVAFQGRVRDPLLLRQLLLALYDGVAAETRSYGEDESGTLDPVITVHHDQLFLEAFSPDQSSYLRLATPLTAFEPEGEVRYGTTNIDFNADLRGALQRLRGARRTSFSVGAGGFGVTTAIGSGTQEHFERKVDIPDNWVKGFLQVQGALTMPRFSFDIHPVDLLSVLAYQQEHKVRRPPYGMRYELRGGEPITLVLEPWEQHFTLRDAVYTGYERTVRVWGRKRLSLLQGVLPYADRVTVGVLGRGLPHLYTCHCGPYDLTLVLSGWTTSEWSKDAAFDLLAPRAAPDPRQVERVYAFLGEHLVASVRTIAGETSIPDRVVERALFQLCRAGRVMADPTTGRYRLRELFAAPLDVDTLFAPDPRLAAARQLVDAGGVTLRDIHPPTPGQGRQETRAEATVRDGAASYPVTVAVDDTGRVRFGRCACPFFEANLMSRGPCAHILAARLALDAATAATKG